MKNQPFILPLLGLILGIFLSELYPQIPSSNPILIAFFLVLIIFIGILILKKQFSFLIFFSFLLLGGIFSWNYNKIEKLPQVDSNHEVNLKLKVVEIYRHSEKNRKYKVEILQIDSLNYSKNYSLLYMKKDAQELFVNDMIWIHSKIQSPQKALNPHQFDYAKFLKRKRIHTTIFAKSILKIESNSNSISNLSSRFKRNIHSKLIVFGYSKQVADQIGAMLLGDRTEMDPQVEDSYRKTGVVHILAISGLHVMMVYSIFYLLLFPISYLTNGKTIRIFISLFLIWSFVVLVGFHPPVLRSAIMIAVFHITVAFLRKPNVYHTLAVSALILLLINPNFLFEPGFQLSFSAVFFIVFFDKALQTYNIFRSKWKKSAYNFVATCVSAQAGTLPFSIYYFNQTSGLFLAGNLVMIIASYLMIAGGLLTVLLVSLNLNFTLWTKFFNGFIESCNTYIQWLSSFESFVYNTVRLNSFEVLLLFFALIIFRFILMKPKIKLVFSFLIVIFLFQSHRFFENYNLNQKKEIVIFHQYKNSVIGIRNGKKMNVFMHNLEDTINLKKYTIRTYSIHENITEIRFKSFEDLKTRSSKTSSYSLLSQNYNLDSLELNSQLILDGSSYPNHTLNFKQETVWDTKTQGSITISLNDFKANKF